MKEMKSAADPVRRQWAGRFDQRQKLCWGATEGTAPMAVHGIGPCTEVLAPDTPVSLLHLKIVGHSLPIAHLQSGVTPYNGFLPFFP